MRGFRRRLIVWAWLFACLALLRTPAASASSTGIAVSVNGRAVATDVAPFVEQHRVLVPMRAVFSALGAYVDFDAPTKTVIVARPQTTIELRVFSQRADVNGNTVWLDEPAVLRNGRTMVPLRFVAQASGADVTFDDRRNVVRVSMTHLSVANERGTGYSGPHLRNVRGSAIDSLTLDTHGKQMLVAGDVLQVNVVGTPGGHASFDLAGIVAGAAMHEISAGTYSGFYVVRAGRNVHDVHAYAHLNENHTTADATSGEIFSVAGRAPSVVASSPRAGERTFVAQPSITAAIDDHGGPAVDANSLRVYVDNTDVTPYSGVSARSLYFTPYYPLAPGWHRVGVYGDDVAGIPFSSDWSFFVEPLYAYGSYGAGSSCGYGGFGQSGFPIFSMTPMQFGTYGPGSLITLVMQGMPGGYGIAQVVGAGGSVILHQVGGMSGYYVGSYVVPPGLDLWPVSFNVDYFGPNGERAHAHEGSGLRFVSGETEHVARLQPIVRRPSFATGVVAAVRAAGGSGAVDADQPVARRPIQISPLPVMHLPARKAEPTVAPQPVVARRPLPVPRSLVSPLPEPTLIPLPVRLPSPLPTPRNIPTARPIEPLPVPLPPVTPRPVPIVTPAPAPSPARVIPTPHPKASSPP